MVRNYSVEIKKRARAEKILKRKSCLGASLIKLIRDQK